MPYLTSRMNSRRSATTQTLKGDLMPMVASDGPHYGDNVKLFWPGQVSPEADVCRLRRGPMAFGRHTDKETCVGPWFKPFTIEYDFPFAGIGKKGGY